MKKNKLLIGIRSLKQLKQETLDAFKKADARLAGADPVNRLYFTDQATLFSCLSPKRWEVMKFIRKNGPISIKKLAASLKRDYKNVYDDVQQLCQVDLIKKNKEDKLMVPWDDIVIELNIAA